VAIFAVLHFLLPWGIKNYFFWAFRIFHLNGTVKKPQLWVV
jgi:hypothetical protein